MFDKWIKKFESTSLQALDWYESSTALSIVTFGSFINSSMESAQKSMSFNTSNSSSGGSFGGGDVFW